jgi:hypothetical protein
MPIGVMQFPEANDTANIKNPLANAIQSGLKTYQNLQDIESKNYANTVAGAQAQYAQPMAQADLQQAQAKPQLTIAQTAYQNALAKGYPSEVAKNYATAAQTQADTYEQKIKNQFLPQREAAEIKEIGARGSYYNMGGGRGSTGSKDQALFTTLVGKDNPQLNDDQVQEASNVLASGGNKLSDGTPINQMSPLTRMTYDRAIKATSTAKLITAGVQANQADSELKVLTDHVAPVIKDMGTTYGNKSIEQLRTSFSDKPEDQEKLGRIIGARSLQYAIAQLRNRIDMGEPGINATKELMDNSGQVIDQMAPRITPAAREAALKFMNEGVEKALVARNKAGVGASTSMGYGNQQNPSSSNAKVNNQQNISVFSGPKWKRVKGKLVRVNQ